MMSRAPRGRRLRGTLFGVNSPAPLLRPVHRDPAAEEGLSLVHRDLKLSLDDALFAELADVDLRGFAARHSERLRLGDVEDEVVDRAVDVEGVLSFRYGEGEGAIL